MSAGNAAECGGLANGAAGVGGGGAWSESGGNCRGGATGRTAGHCSLWPMGFFNRAVKAGFVGGAHGELVHIGFAQHHGAGLLEVFDHGGVVGRDKVVEHLRAAAGADAVGAEDIFVQNGHATEMPVHRRRPGAGRQRQRPFSACSAVTVMTAL